MDLYGVVNRLDFFKRQSCGEGKKYPAVEKTMIVPAQVLRQEAAKYKTADGDGPLSYLQRYIDQDPDSLYLFIACDARKGDASRDMAHQFFDEFMYDVCGMGSTYDRKSGAQPIPGRPETAEFGRYDRSMAIHKEILPAIDDTTFQRYYEQQVQAAAEELRRMFGVDEPEPEAPAAAEPEEDDSDVIDMVDVGDGDYRPSGEASRDAKAVQARQTYSVGRAKPIFYAVDFHMPASMALGYDNDSSGIAYDSDRGMIGLGRGGNRRLGGGNRRLRESNISRGMMAAIAGAYKWLCQQGKCDGVVDGTYAWSETGPKDVDLFIFKYEDGRQCWVEQDKNTSKYSFAMDPGRAASYAGRLRDMYKIQDGLTMTVDEISNVAAELGECDGGPRQMMREFVEAKAKAKAKKPVKKPAKKAPAKKPAKEEPGDDAGFPDGGEVDENLGSASEVSEGKQLLNILKDAGNDWLLQAGVCIKLKRNNGSQAYCVPGKAVFEDGVLKMSYVPTFAKEGSEPIALERFLKILREAGAKLSSVESFAITEENMQYDHITVSDKLITFYFAEKSRSLSDEYGDVLSEKDRDLAAEYGDVLSEKDGCCGKPGCDCADECDSFELNESLVRFASRLIRD